MMVAALPLIVTPCPTMFGSALKSRRQISSPRIAVFGEPDEQWGQRVCAAVVGDVDLDELKAWARERLAPAKRPKVYVRYDALPHTATGKMQRLKLASS